MFLIVKGLTCLALLCTWSVFILAQDSPIRSFSKKYTIPEVTNNASNSPTISFHDETELSYLHNLKYWNYILYSTCKHKQDSNFISCNVTIRSWPYSRVNSLTICKNYEISGRDLDVKIYRISENIIFFILETPSYQLWEIDYYHYYKLNINILNMENCSNMANISFVSKMKEEGTRPIVAIVFDKTFEIIVRNETYCNGMPVCKINYDLNGNKIDEPKPFEIEEIKTLLPLSFKSSDEGYYALVAKNDEICEVQHVNSSGGNRRKLMTMPIKFYFAGLADMRNELFTICARHENDSREFQCLQSDTQGMRLNVTIELPTYGKNFIIHNLAGGGILISFGICDVEEISPLGSEILNCKEFQIQRIGADGHMFKPLIIDGFDKTDVSKLFQHQSRVIENGYSYYRRWMIENDHNEFCFPMAGLLRSSNKTISTPEILYYKWCIPKELTL